MARQGSQVSGTRVVDFSPSKVSAEGMDRKMAPAGIVVHQGGSFPTPHNGREVVIFLLFLVVGAVPPFSPFLMAVLEDFAIHLVNLTPNAILTLVLFAHACEMFMVVHPLVELFLHFFTICRSASLSPGPGAAPQPRFVGGVFFKRHGSSFLPLARRGKWENWERHWLYIEVHSLSPLLLLSQGPPAGNNCWTEVPVLGAMWASVMGRIETLWQARLTSTMVAAEFFRRCLAPLQARPHPSWFYDGDGDASRLGRGAEFNHNDHMVAEWLELSMDEKDPAVAFLHKGILPLCEDPSQEVVLCLHPVMDERGLALLPPPPPPTGHSGGPAPGGGSHPVGRRRHRSRVTGDPNARAWSPSSWWSLPQHPHLLRRRPAQGPRGARLPLSLYRSKCRPRNGRQRSPLGGGSSL
jgi:hypothetical protein